MRNTLITVLILLIAVTISAQNRGLTATFTPASLNVNMLYTTSFDPFAPHNQPLLTTLTITNSLDESYPVDLQVRVRWNGILLVTADFRTKEGMGIPANGTFYLTNRDLITNHASTNFIKLDDEIDLQEIINASNLLRDAALSGSFPDGTITIEIAVKRTGTAAWASEADFSITVQNIGNIYAVYPGNPLGGVPPIMNPTGYLWNALFTNFNTFNLTIKEFPPNNPPTSGNIETSGTVFFANPAPMTTSSFTDFLPYRDNHYYAWQVSSTMFTETNPLRRGRSGGTSGEVKSNWHVFQFNASIDTQDQQSEFFTILSLLNNPLIINMLNSGWRPTGTVIYNGRFVSGQDALDLLNSLIGLSIEAEIVN